MRGKGSRGCCVRWLIVGLLVLIVLVGLVVFIRRRHFRPAADDTLVTDLLGPPDLPTIPASRARWTGTRPPAQQARRTGTPAPARQAREEGQSSPARQAREEGQSSPARQAREEGDRFPARQAREKSERTPAPPASGDGEVRPASPASPDAEDDWLETQLAWINTWSQRINQQITSAEQPGP